MWPICHCLELGRRQLSPQIFIVHSNILCNKYLAVKAALYIHISVYWLIIWFVCPHIIQINSVIQWPTMPLGTTKHNQPNLAHVIQVYPTEPLYQPNNTGPNQQHQNNIKVMWFSQMTKKKGGDMKRKKQSVGFCTPHGTLLNILIAMHG